MNEKVNINKDYRCIFCNKHYASQSSLCNHNKKFHKLNVVQKGTKDVLHVVVCGTSMSNNKSECKFCNKLFNDRSNKYKHEKICKKKINNSEIETLKNTINEMKKQFSLILKEKGKMHHKTLQKINNQLNNTTNSNNNINSGNIINNTFVKFGELEYQKVLNNSQIKQILNKQYQSLEESIKQIHFNEELPEYSNIFITNMKDDLAYIFNGKQFISVRKNEMIHELIDIHTKEIN